MTLNAPYTALRAATDCDSGNTLLADADVPVQVSGVALTHHQEAQDDGESLAHGKDLQGLQESAGTAPPLVFKHKKSNAAWTVGSLAMLLLAGAVPVVRGGPMRLSKELQDDTSGADWIEQLPHDVVGHMDTQVDPCDDLYAFSCGSWLKQAKIPDDKSHVSLSYTRMRDDIDKVLQEVMQQEWPLLGELYDSCMSYSNTSSATENAASIAFLKPVIKQIAATTSKSELFQLAGKLSKAGLSFLTKISDMADVTENTVYAVRAHQTGLSLPDSEYYLDPKWFESVSDPFHAYIVKLFSLVGWESHEAASLASSVIAFEKKLAPFFVPEYELQDPETIYNPMSVAQAAEKYPLLFAQFMRGTGTLKSLNARNATVVDETPAFFQRVEKIVTGDSVTLDILKAVLTYRYISDKASTLSEPFAQAYFSFFQQTLDEKKSRDPRWKVCLQHVTDSFPDLVGKYYGLLRFDKASERLAKDLVMQVQASLKKGLMHLDWLDESSRQGALEKLGKMTTLIGYSNRSDHFPYKLHGDALLAENLRIINEHAFDQAMARIDHPVDRNAWEISGVEPIVYYRQDANQITVPAGSFQSPAFALDEEPARNFGAIGRVLASILTHAFDAYGKGFDGDGNLKDWWSNKTATEFSQRADCFLEQYSKFSVRSSEDQHKVLGHIDGELTLSENIADSGGLKLSFQAYRTYAAKQAKAPSKIEEGKATTVSQSEAEPDLPPDVADKLFFISFAQNECSKRTDASTTEDLATKIVSPDRWRINGAAGNLHDFARVFSCPAGSPMNPTKKCQIW